MNDHRVGSATLAEGGQIEYQIHGLDHDGIPVLLIRPLGGSMALWGQFRAKLSERFRVISFDLRGMGHARPEAGRTSTRGLARDALDVLIYLDVEQANVFGISLGGMAATWLGILAPRRVAKLCVASAPACGLEMTRAGLGRELALAACFGQREVEVCLVHRVLSKRFQDRHPAEVRRIDAALRLEPTSRITLAKHAIAGVLHHVGGELGRIRAPTLVLAGDDDTLMGTRAPHALARAIPGAAFDVIGDSGHDLTLEQPLTTASRVADFFLSPPAPSEG